MNKQGNETTAGNRVYFAGPLFCQSEKDFNKKIAAVLEKHGYEVFLPQRDGYEAAQLRDHSEEEVVAKIFAKAVNCENPQDGSPCGECAMCKAIAAGSMETLVIRHPCST